jgi:hypothetical protein
MPSSVEVSCGVSPPTFRGRGWSPVRAPWSEWTAQGALEVASPAGGLAVAAKSIVKVASPSRRRPCHIEAESCLRHPIPFWYTSTRAGARRVA